MNNKVSSYIFVLLLVLINGCVQQASTSNKTEESNGIVEEATDGSTPPDFTDTQDIFWFNTTDDSTKTLTLNADTNTNQYLRGSSIHNFLGAYVSSAYNYNRSYCLVISYNHGSAKKNLRLFAKPNAVTNVFTGKKEYLFRLDLQDSSASQTSCSGTSLQILTTADSASSVGDIDSSFDLPNLCTSCNQIISSTDVSLYDVTSSLTTSTRVQESELNLGGLTLRVNSFSNTSTTNPSCSNTSCSAKGFDCCLDGQCVKDGSLRPNASIQVDYSAAILDVATNPDHFTKWPNVYFVCGEKPVTEPTSPVDTDPTDEAQKKLAEQIAKYNCMEEGKKTTPNYAAQNVCLPGYDQASYEAIRAAVWQECGCSATATSCNYELELVYDSTNTNVVRTQCTQVTTEDTSFTHKTVTVSTRSAPHRFYRNDNGVSVDDITTLASTVTAEGESFQYLDNSNKALPVCGASNGSCSFNFNSIIGQMSVDLSTARPALAIDIEYDQSYIIQTLTGNHTPCPQCDEDQWFNDFAAHPSSQTGTGLNGTSYTTNREIYADNTSRGNYEDTVFGRACFVPPTMLPYSHKPNSNTVTQRQNRLTTQAALYMNGYQRDWYGFNYGALIGSFDGVSWFAIGSGLRRVTSKSKKLFLAINAPFADLASSSSFSVNITLDNGGSLAPSYDYDPTQTFDDLTKQTSAASCQRWHQCNTDTDCITKLGWEYQCQDTSRLRTSWPKFNGDGDEQSSDEYADTSFSRFIANGFAPGSKKRCVYRGAGALCKKNFTTNVDSNKQKILSCAPNFHCAGLDSSTFNQEIVRSVSVFSSPLFGQETDILGRPKDYINAINVLSTTIKDNIKHSGAYLTTDTSDLGLCRPGRKTDETTYTNQHSMKDNINRTDYINQVGTCAASASGTDRTRACPHIEMESGQSTAKGDLVLSVDLQESAKQNSCGEETKYYDGLAYQNSFSTIEKDVTPTTVISRSLASNACKRRPGQVCHTDLDCSPNRLYAQRALTLDVSYFGGTEAERSYWQEELTCGQAAQAPSYGDEGYEDYDMSLNRCCREVGKDFTMHTQGDPETQTLNPSLNVTTYPADSPTTDGRYSRYASVNATDGNPAPATTTTPYAQAPIVDQTTGTMPKAFQWKTLNDTGKNTCCGGGWIRKFDDNSTSWNVSSRLNLPVENLACLNYKTDNYQSAVDGVDSTTWSTNFLNFCLYPANGGCIQQGFSPSSGITGLFPPSLNDGVSHQTATLDTKPYHTPQTQIDGQGSAGMAGLSLDVPYEPLPYANPTHINTAGTEHYSYFRSRTTYPAVSFYLPSYIGYQAGGISNITSIRFIYYDASGAEVSNSTPALDGVCAVTTNPSADLATDNYCIALHDGNYVFHGHAATAGVWEYGSVEITFNLQNGPNYVYTGGATDNSQISMTPGNEEYYLTKLARLELLGVPQIVYEPIFCNSNRNTLVDGIFNLTSSTREQFYNESHVMDATNLAVNGRPLASMYNEDLTAPTTTQSSNYDTDGNGVADTIDPTHLWDPPPVTAPYTYTEAQERFVFSDKISLPKIFSSHEFRCCTSLGSKAATDSKCCSGHRDNEGVCKLPDRANLNVYFNKFISSEGMGDDMPGGGLEDTDFIPETGEPKMTSAVGAKIRALGEAYCSSGVVRTGGSFGYFAPGPSEDNLFVVRTDGATSISQEEAAEKSKRYSIVDSTLDYDDANKSGYQFFQKGFRWDHQYYCDEAAANP